MFMIAVVRLIRAFSASLPQSTKVIEGLDLFAQPYTYLCMHV